MAKFFSDREIRAVAVFLPLAGLLIGGIVLLRPKADPQAAFVAGMEMEGRADSVDLRPFAPIPWTTTDFGGWACRSTKP